MLTAEQFNEQMQRMGEQVASLASQTDDPASIKAAELLRSFGQLHSHGLRRILEIIDKGGGKYQALREQFMQDDLIRSMLLCHDLHPVDLKTRVTEAIDSLRPLAETCGVKVSIATISSERVTLRLETTESDGSSKTMLKDLLEHGIVVAAPDVAEIQFDDSPIPMQHKWPLPILRT